MDVAPPRSRPDMTDRNTARKRSSNKIIPRINSVSEFPVRLRSTRTLATIAVEDTDSMPAMIKVSYNGKLTKKNHKLTQSRSSIERILFLQKQCYGRI